MTQIISPILLLILLAIPNISFSQSCECTNCGAPAPVSATTDFTFVATGAVNNSLASAGQGVCAVYIEFAPDHIWSLEMILTSPGGQQVTLIGAPGFGGFFSGSLTWDITFLPCGETAMPDPGFSAVWDNNQAWTIGSNYNGSYYPHSGCLEDFNTGTVDGVWTLSVNNTSPFNIATIYDFQMIFCDQEGLDCFPCDANAGSIKAYPDIIACPNDPALEINMTPDYGGDTPPDETEYGYTFIIAQNDTILAYDTLPDLQAFVSGTYTICGLSYLLEDSLDIPNANGLLTMADMEADFLSLAPDFCGDITDACLDVIILSLDTTFISDTICVDEVYPFQGMNFDTTGIYPFTLSGSGMCDSVVILDLTVLDSIHTFITASICRGEQYCLGLDCFSIDGEYDVQLTSNQTPFCDSLVTLTLVVEESPILSLSDTICRGDSVVIRGEAFFTTGIHYSFPDPAIRCDTLIELNLLVGEPVYTSRRDTLCAGDTLWIDTHFFEETGFFEIPYLSSIGCDSILQINLTVLDSIKTTLIDTLCAGDTLWIGNQAFFSDGYYEVNLISAFNCDSLVQLNLEVRDTNQVFIRDSLCLGEILTIGTTDLTATGIYEITLMSSLACDSIVHVDLTVFDPLRTSVDSTICQGDFVQIGTREFNETGTYLVPLTSSVGCDSTVELNLTVLDPIAIIEPFNLLACDNNPVRLDASNSGGQNLIFQWIDLNNGGLGIVEGADSVIALVNLTGTYQLIVTDTLNGQSCTATNFVGVAGSLDAPQIFAFGDTLTCEDSVLQLNAIAITANLDYEWTGPGTFYSTDLQPTVNVPGEYTLVATATNQCTDTIRINIIGDFVAPEVFAEVLDTLDCQMPLVPLEGGSNDPTDTYQWTGPGTFSSTLAATLAGVPGDYTFTGTAANGCMADTTITVLIDTIPPEAIIEGDTISCTQPNGQLTTLTSATDLIYSWLGPGTFTSALQNPITTLPGIYNLTITASNACTNSYTTLMVADTLAPDIALSTDTLTCDSLSVPLIVYTATTDVTYSWLGPGTFNSILPNPTANEAGWYYLTLTAFNGCESTDSIEVVQDTLAPGVLAIGDTLDCQTTTVQIFATSSITTVDYSWTGPGTFVSTLQNPMVSSVGEYVLTVTAPNGCESIDTAFVVADEDLPGVSALGDTINCLGTLAQLLGDSPTAGASFEWTGPGTFFSTLQNPSTNIPGDYTLTAIGTNGCRSQIMVTVLEDLLSPIITATGGMLDCATDSIQLQSTSDSPNVIYSWAGPGTFTASIAEPFAFIAGEYILTVTALNGCESIDTALLIQDFTAPDILAIGDTLTCENDSVQLFGNSIDPGVSYSWTGPAPFTSSVQNPMVDQTGAYILTVTGANACTSVDTAWVLEDKTLPGAIAIGDTLTCIKDSIQLLGNSPTADVGFSWTGPGIFTSTLQNPMAGESGMYYLLVRGANGCVSTDSAEVINNVVLPGAMASGEDTLDCQQNTIQLNGNSPTVNVSYFWLGPGTFTSPDQNPIITNPGQYILVVTGANACRSTDTLQIAIDTLSPGAMATGDTLDCQNNSIQIFGSSPTANVSYSWTGPGTFGSVNQNPAVTEPGEYILTVQGENGCTSLDSVIVIEDENLPGAIANADTLNCQNDTIQLMGNSPTPGVSYFWVGPGTFASGEQNPFTALAGQYILFVTGPNGCESQQTIDVVLDTISPVASLAADSLSCQIDSVQLLATISTPIANLEWTGPGLFNTNIANPFVQNPGTYYLNLTGTNTCQSIDSIEIIDNRVIPDVQARGDTLTCRTDSIQLNGMSTTIGVTYDWTGTGGFISIEQNPWINAGGEYILTVATSDGCTASDTVQIFSDTLLPDAHAIGDTLDCQGSGAQLQGASASTAVDFSWMGPGTFSSPDQNPLVFSPGEYILIVTGSNGCESRDTVMVVEDIGLPGASIIGDTLNCQNDSIQLLGNSPSIGVSYSWTGPSLFVSAAQNPMIGEAGEYILIVTGANGCQSQESISILQDTISPGLTLLADTLGCLVDSIQLSAMATSTINSYAWTGPGTFNENIAAPFTSLPGTYYLTVIGTNFCESSDSILVVDNTELPDVLAAGDTLTCENDTIQLIGMSSTAGVQYSWTGPGTFISPDQNPMTDTPGEYILTVNAPNGCRAMDTVLIIGDTLLPGALALGDTLDCTGNGAQLQGGSPTAMVDFLWTGPGTYSSLDPNPVVFSPGEYILIVTAVNGCQSRDTILVEEDINLPGASILGDTLTCAKDTIQLFGNSPSSAVSYAWTGPIPFSSIDQNPIITIPGEYSLTVTGANGCESQELFLVLQDTLPPGATAIGDTLTCTSTILQLSGNSLSSEVTYFWTGPGTFTSMDQNPVVSELGEYILTVGGANACVSTDTTLLIDEIILPGALALGDTLTCEADSVQLMASSPGSGVTYSWTGPGTFSSLAQNPMTGLSGEYILSVINAEGCESLDTTQVFLDTLAPGAQALGDTLNCLDTLITLFGNATTTEVTYLWTGPGTFNSALQNPMVNIEGQYFLEVEATNGCISRDTAWVIADVALPGASANGDTLNCLNDSISLAGNSPTANVNYLWAGPQSFSSSQQFPFIQRPGNYYLTVTGANGCISQDSVLIVEDRVLPGAMAIGDTLNCAVDSIALEGTSPTINVDYQWTGPASFSSFEQYPFTEIAGTYYLEITGNNGCVSVDSAEVIADFLLPGALAMGDTLTCNNSAIQIFGNSPSADVDFSWTGPGTYTSILQNPMVNESGSYILMVTGANFCTSYDTIQVEEDVNLPGATATGDTLNCEIDSVQLFGNSPSSDVLFSWTGPNTYTSIEQNPIVTIPGEYLLMVEALNGCQSLSTALVVIDTLRPDVQAFGDTLDCNTGAGQLLVNSSTAGATFSWTGPNNFMSDQVNPMVLVEGLYTIVVEAPNSCLDSAVVAVVPEENVPLALAEEADTLNCELLEVTLDGSASIGDPDLEYSWWTSENNNIGNLAMANVDSAGWYYLQVTNPSNGCLAWDSVLVEIDTIAPQAFVNPIGGLSLTCNTNSIVLDATGTIATGNLSFYWWLDNTLISTDPNPEIDGPGIYTLIATSEDNACADSLVLEIIQDDELPLVLLAEPEILNCRQDTILLDAFGSNIGPGYTLEWISSGPPIVSGENTANPAVNQAGNYRLVITNESNGCRDSASVDVFADFNFPIAEAGEGSALNCHITSLDLNGMGSSTGQDFNYQWEGPAILSGENSLEPSIAMAGWYILKVEDDSNGCQSKDSVEVLQGNPGPGNLELSLSAPPCYGEAKGRINIDTIFGGVEPYLYSLDNAPFVSWPLFNNLGAGTYSLSIQDAEGCELDTVLTIENPSPIGLALGEDTLIQLGASVDLNPQISSASAYTFVWLENTFLACDTCLAQSVMPLKTSIFDLTITDENGCVAQDRRTIYVEEGNLVFIPSAFSPNGDGVNDAVGIFSSPAIAKIKTFLIFDRWGEVVHERLEFLPDDPGKSWDGNFRGKALNPAVFVYFAELELLDGSTRIFEGSITLIR